MPRPSVAVVIGAYLLDSYVRLNIRATRKVFGDVPILVSDDLSERSGVIEDLCADEGVSYMCSKARRSHVSGDQTAFINGQVFARQCGAEVAVKFSQRFVPAKVEFSWLLLEPFSDDNVWLVYPPRIDSEKRLARSTAKIYLQFPLLTDALAWRSDRITADELMDAYKTVAARAGDRSTVALRKNLFPETVWHYLLETKFREHARGVSELSNPPRFSEKLFLRKAQCLGHEYQVLGQELGVEVQPDLREWKHIETKAYMCLPATV